MKFNITTFNIRCDYGQDGKNNFEFRAPLVKEAIKKYDSDIIGFQEVRLHIYQWLKKNLSPEYTVVGCGRDKNLEDEHMILAFKTDKFDLLEMTTKWLSDTPDVYGSRFKDQSICPRVYTKFLLRSVEDGSFLYVYVTHLDHESAYARAEGIRQIVKAMDKDRKEHNVPSILMGDFNEDSRYFDMDKVLDGLNIDVRDVSKDSGITFHNYGIDCNEIGKIDYIFVTPEFKDYGVKTWNDCENGVYLSDHYPVSVDLEL